MRRHRRKNILRWQTAKRYIKARGPRIGSCHIFLPGSRGRDRMQVWLANLPFSCFLSLPLSLSLPEQLRSASLQSWDTSWKAADSLQPHHTLPGLLGHQSEGDLQDQLTLPVSHCISKWTRILLHLETFYRKPGLSRLTQLAWDTHHTLYFYRVWIAAVTSINLYHFNIETSRNQGIPEAMCYITANQKLAQQPIKRWHCSIWLDFNILLFNRSR